MIPNPKFAGSRDVGGADADFIIDHCLIDLKTTAKRSLDRTYVYQLVGYPLLDYGDALAISHIGLYASRIPALLTWPLADVIHDMSGGRATVSSLRVALRSLLQEPQDRPRPNRVRPRNVRPGPRLWTSKDDLLLTQLAADGVPIGLAANQLDRAYSTVVKHAHALGLQFERDRQARIRHRESVDQPS